MSKVRWGILSTAKIGLNTVIPAMQRGQHSEITAIASRNKEKADTAARRLGIPKAYGSYEELLDDPNIQAIYNPLPNHLHVPWTLKCLEAGKHVLCEKPISTTLMEAEQLLSAAKRYPKLKLMEAFMYRFHSQWKTVRAIMDSGTIGTVKWIQSYFTYHNTNPQDIRNKADHGGGGLLDIGCYCISISRFLFNAEPRRVYGVIDFDPDTTIDRLTSGILDFEHGRATFTCGTQLARMQKAEIFGSEGKLEMDLPFNPGPDVNPGIVVVKGLERTNYPTERVDQYTLQGDLFSKAILHDTPVPTPLADAVSNMRVIEGIFQSARTNTWIEIR